MMTPGPAFLFKRSAMLHKAAICLLLGLTACAAVAADAYQRVIDAAAPGYEILGNEDMVQDESALRTFLSADEIAKRKQRQSPGLITGRFNDDSRLDFAALVVNRSIKGKGPDRQGHFAARLVVCLGAKAPQHYRCEILPTLKGDFISLPYWADLELFKVSGEIQCGTPGETIRANYPRGWKGHRPGSGERALPALRLRPNYDAIGEYAIGSNSGRTLVRRADAVYLDCADAD
jgi:hypothetical protein